MVSRLAHSLGKTETQKSIQCPLEPKPRAGLSYSKDSIDGEEKQTPKLPTSMGSGEINVKASLTICGTDVFILAGRCIFVMVENLSSLPIIFESFLFLNQLDYFSLPARF